MSLTGLASVDHYAVMPREKTLRCYCDSIDIVERKFEGHLDETSRFADLELIETADPIVRFDSRTTGVGLAAASTVQTWLELRAAGKRERETADVVMQRVIEELREAGWSRP